MKELIKIENDAFILDIDASNKIAEFERQIKLIKEAEDAVKEVIKAEMEARGILKVEDKTNGMTITYIAPSHRETFDSKKFKADNPDMYDEYVKLTPVKSSIRIKLD
jgi:2,3-bisphosphoglycerate-independent phosphoglycerate mutase